MIKASHPRDAFLQFLADISSGIYSASDWDSMIVTHYSDLILEEVRVQFVRASISAGEWSPPIIPEILRASVKDLYVKLAGAGAWQFVHADPAPGRLNSGVRPHMPTYRRLVGSVHAVPIDGTAYAYGVILPEADFAVFDHKSSTPELPAGLLETPMLFRVAVRKSAWSKGRWPRVGKLELPAELLQSVPRFMRDALKPDIYSIYLGGSIKPATRQQCIGLECMAVWEPEHVESRLSDHYAGRVNIWVEQLALGEA